MTDDLPTYEQVLHMLAAKAGDGSVSAMVALERALRHVSEHEREWDELDALLEAADPPQVEDRR